MADHETLEESLDFAFVSKDGKFVGNRGAVLSYNQEHSDSLKEYGLPWTYHPELGARTDTMSWPIDKAYRRLYRAFASLDEASQRALLMRVEDE